MNKPIHHHSENVKEQKKKHDTHTPHTTHFCTQLTDEEHISPIVNKHLTGFYVCKLTEHFIF